MMTNMSSGTISPTPIASLQVQGEGGTEIYEQHVEIITANRPSGPNPAVDDIAPRQMLISQFVFDVPTDVYPELLIVRDEPTIDSSFEIGNVDLTEDDPQGPRPEEVLALQSAYVSMTAWESAYELYAQESQERIPFGQYRPRQVQAAEENPTAITDYAFPSVEVQGDRATVERIYTFNDASGEIQDRATNELVLEDDG